MKTIAPVALFVYNRPDHTRRTLSFLRQNQLAEESRLFIFSDGAKTVADKDKVAEVRELIRAADGFKSIEIMEQPVNLGLANSIIQGVTLLVEKYGKVIVFEDDLVSSPYTLRYFNDALNLYADQESVMHIGAYMYPLKREGLPQTFFYRAASSWGWATWQRAWHHFEPDVQVLMDRFTPEMIHRFSIERTMNFWKQMEAFRAGKNNSWAIRWYASIFLANGLTLNPSRSLVNNIGHDGSGIHSGINDMYYVAINPDPITSFPSEVKENPQAYEAIRSFLKKRKGSLLKRVMRFVNERVLPSRFKHNIRR